MLTLNRYDALPQATMGVIHIPGRTLHTLELPWRNNRTNLSCIPTGTYPLKMHYGQRFRGVYRLGDVPGRTGILIHAGNYPWQIQGCILVGLARTEDPDTPRLFESRAALEYLNDYLRTWQRPEVRIVWSTHESF